jgi:hypothetical protein
MVTTNMEGRGGIASDFAKCEVFNVLSLRGGVRKWEDFVLICLHLFLFFRKVGGVSMIR